MILLALSGKKQSGKDTVCQIIKDMLAREASPYSLKHINFADALYKEVAIALWPAIEYSPKAIQGKIDYIKANKDNFRLILQGWGTDYRRKLFGKDYWIKKWEQQNRCIGPMHTSTTIVLCSDCRFLNEYETIRRYGGNVWRISRTPGYIDDHPSETELDVTEEQGGFDRHIHNDWSLDTLRKVVEDEFHLLIKQKQ